MRATPIWRSFTIPRPLHDRRPFEVHLTVRGAIWPSHVWPLVAPDLRMGLPILLYIGAASLAFAVAIGFVVLRGYRARSAVQAARSPEEESHTRT
jgi:hypothetical protein